VDVYSGATTGRPRAGARRPGPSGVRHAFDHPVFCVRFVRRWHGPGRRPDACLFGRPGGHQPARLQAAHRRLPLRTESQRERARGVGRHVVGGGPVRQEGIPDARGRCAQRRAALRRPEVRPRLARHLHQVDAARHQARPSAGQRVPDLIRT